MTDSRLEIQLMKGITEVGKDKCINLISQRSPGFQHMNPKCSHPFASQIIKGEYVSSGRNRMSGEVRF